VELVITGEAAVSDIVAHLEEDRSGQDPQPLLINVGESAILPQSVELRRIGQAIVCRQGEVCPPVAVFVTQAVRFGLARQLGAFLESAGVELRPFTDREAAIAWLTDWKR
jgi:hypothetical protein